MLPTDWADGWPNVWHYRQRWPILASIPARVRFVSYEPAIGPLGALDRCTDVLPHWVICGGESGGQRRPLHIEWVRDVRDQCEAHGISFFFKQIGGLRWNSGGCELDGCEWKEWPMAA